VFRRISRAVFWHLGLQSSCGNYLREQSGTVSTMIHCKVDPFALLRKNGHLLSLCKDTTLFLQSGPATAIYLIESGAVKLTRVSSEGEQTVVAIGSVGWILGLSSVTLNLLYTATAITLIPSKITCIPAERIRSLLRTDLSIASEVVRAHSHELHSHFMHLADSKSLSARSRLNRLLFEWIVFSQRGTSAITYPIEIPLRHAEIAGLVGVSPQHLSRLTRQMEKEGVIRKGRNRISVLPLKFRNTLFPDGHEKGDESLLGYSRLGAEALD
jgi:CRP-like cAMP-binding protein